MFFVTFMRYMKGYLRFSATGAFVERFLNLCARGQIPVWSGQKHGNSYTGYTTAHAYHAMRHHAKKTGVKIRIIEKQGMPFKRRKYRKRTGLVVGLVLFISFIFFISSFIWRIEISGNDKVSQAKILEVLSDIGVSQGSLRSGIDVRESERLTMLKIKELSWVAFNISGSTLYLKVSESVPPPKMVDPNTPCNVIATHTGQILTLRVYDGQPLLKEGYTVMAGDVIVSGITKDRLEQNLFKHALADVTARVDYTISVQIPLNQIQYIETGKQTTRSYLKLFNFDLPLFIPFKLPQPYRVEREEQSPQPLGSKLPFGILREKYILMREEPITYSEDQVVAMAVDQLKKQEAAELPGAEILSRTLDGHINDGVFVLKANYSCIISIGQEKEILKEKPLP